MMQLESYLAQFLSPLLTQKTGGEVKTTEKDFAKTLDESATASQTQMVKIGEGKYRIEFQNQLEEKKENDYQRIQSKPTDSAQQSEKVEKKEAKEPSSIQPHIAQFVIHPIFREIYAKEITPTLKAFITQAVAVIKSVPLENGAQQYQFQFKEPPITVTFESKQHNVKITIRSEGTEQNILSELEANQKELTKQLEAIFKEQSLEFSIKVESVSDHEQKNKRQKDNQNQQQKFPTEGEIQDMMG